MNRRKAREKALQKLFQLEFYENLPIETSEESSMNDNFFNRLVEGVAKQTAEIDQVITENLDNWKFDRIASVEKTVLRIAVYEIKYMDDIPNNVSINEAIELAKKFGDEKSSVFVNGVLSNIMKSEGEKYNDSRSN